MASIKSGSKNDLYIVMRRGALRTIVGSAGSAVAFALAAGLALGHYGLQPLQARHGSEGSSIADAAPAQSPYAAAEFTRLRAASASLNARAERLTNQLDSLSALNQRLRAQPRAPAIRAAATSTRRSGSDAAGGPELPPRPCRTSEVQADAQVIRGELDCVSATLTTLEQRAARHETAWEAFPDRRPLVLGRTSSPFGNRLDPFTHHLSFHPGMDLVAPTGTAILAAAGGRVIHAGPMPGYGNAVEIDHGNGIFTLYGHASKVEVRVGQKVLPREPIAKVGSTGRSTGPHLHFEVRVHGEPVNPADYLSLSSSNADA
ncbi:M23 family metallopeptidase [Caballeronia sp. GAWG2-1]|uniref:M23 family metallopeptidase n=1 Tax=Caballeronia sp. GAWG2-1 TaxID=2921744 RepID=UPI0020286089|nr:M23 family metallopeptidase [Caballeronia sp. GAWG2-1]